MQKLFCRRARGLRPIPPELRYPQRCKLAFSCFYPATVRSWTCWTGMQDLANTHTPSQAAVEEIAFEDRANALLGKATDADRPLWSKRRERGREMSIASLV
jgi:hypothetical protein